MYVRARDATGRFWDFVAESWNTNEGAADNKLFLTEYQDSDLVDSRYHVEATPPSVACVFEYLSTSSAEVLAEEAYDPTVATGVQAVVSALASLTPLIGRMHGLMGANRVLDQEVLDPHRRVTSARVRVYDTAANAQTAGLVGLLATYNVVASYTPTGACTMTVVEVLP